MFGFRAYLCLFMVLTAILWFDQADGQSTSPDGLSTTPGGQSTSHGGQSASPDAQTSPDGEATTGGFVSFDQTHEQATTTKYDHERDQQKRCMMRNKGRQRAISKCFVHYTMKNCSLLSQHMECYIREKKKICNVLDDELIDRPFRNMLKRKFIRNTTTPCGQFLANDLDKYECRDCTMASPKVSLTGDAHMINATRIQTGNACVQMDIKCNPKSDNWKSRLTITTISTRNSFVSPDFGQAAVQRLACNVKPRIWLQNNNTLTKVICDSEAIAKDILDYGCGLCKKDNLPVQMTGDKMSETSGYTDKGCASLHYSCVSNTSDYLSQITVNNTTTINSTQGGKPAELLLICTDTHDRWVATDSTATNQAITEVNCVKNFAAAHVLNISCGECTPQLPQIQITGHHIEVPTQKGCKSILVQCTPNDTNWKSSLEINGRKNGSQFTRTLNSSDFGTVIDFRVFCPDNKTAWLDDQNDSISNISCTDNAYAVCGRCNQSSLQSVADSDSKLEMIDVNTQADGCKRLDINCVPEPGFAATLVMNDDPSTKVTSGSGLTASQRIVCKGGTHWQIDGSTNYTSAITKFNCTTKYVDTHPRSTGCGVCQTRGEWLISGAPVEHPPTDRGCRVVEVGCLVDPALPVNTTTPKFVINEAIEYTTKLNSTTLQLTCSSEPRNGSFGGLNWMVKDHQGQMVRIESIRCQQDSHSTPSPCTICTTQHPPIKLEGGFEVLGEYNSQSLCRKLEMNCYRESPDWISAVNYGGKTWYQSSAGQDHINAPVYCNRQGGRWENTHGVHIAEVTCDPRYQHV